MVALRERTRRLWITTLFTIFGPVIFLTAAFYLYWLNTEKAVQLACDLVSGQLRCEVNFKKRELQQPSITRYVNVELYSTSSNSSLLYCPEIYHLRLKDQKLLRAFADSFDSINASTNVSDEEDSSQPPANRIEPRENRSTTSFKELLNDVDERLGYELLIIPTIRCLNTQTNELFEIFRKRILSRLLRQSSKTVCVVIENIQILERDEYEDLRNADATYPRWSKSKLLSTFKTRTYQTPLGDAGITYDSIRKEILLLSSQSPQFEKVRILLYQSPQIEKLDALFEIQNISSPEPFHFSYQKNLASETETIGYYSRKSPTPCILLGSVFPQFSILGQEGWVTGVIESSSDAYDAVSSTSNRIWKTKLESLHLCNCPLDNISRRFALPQGFTGSISDLTINEGVICQGIFTGKGSMKINRGAIPAKVVHRLIDKRALDVSPRNVIQLHFINDAVPFNELESQFELSENGITFNSSYHNKIIAYYEQGNTKYGLFLPASVAGKEIPYAETLSVLFDSQSVDSFWTPLVKNALNHLPVPQTAYGDEGDSVKLR